MFQNKTILITGGTGSFGNKFTERLLAHDPKKIIIYSRDEYKQYIMAQKFNDERVRFFIGDVRDKDRLYLAMRGVDYVVHAAALKHVPICEYNPMEAIKTNVVGAMNVISVALTTGVKRVVALSTDKAVQPLNLYGASKACSDRLFIAGNNLSPAEPRTIFSIVRYGNVAHSRGSVIPFFSQLCNSGCESLPLTDVEMTRFYIDLDDAVNLVFTSFEEALPGEIFIAKIPSFRVVDLIEAYGKKYHIIGCRPGEKIHEIMITASDSLRTHDMGDYYIITPEFHDWTEDVVRGRANVPKGFEYVSGDNTMLSVDELRGCFGKK